MANKDVQDPYSYPGTSVLKNRLGTTNPLTLIIAEQRATALRMLQLRERPVPGAFNFDHLKTIHKHIFQDIYTWAGQTRTVGIQKEQTVFASPRHIEPEGKKIFEQLTRDMLAQAKDKTTFVDRITSFFSDINALHPFREGNGRTQRAFISAYAQQLGYSVDWQQVSKAQMRDVSLDTFQGNEYKANGVFTKIISVTPKNKEVQKILDNAALRKTEKAQDQEIER